MIPSYGDGFCSFETGILQNIMRTVACLLTSVQMKLRKRKVLIKNLALSFYKN